MSKIDKSFIENVISALGGVGNIVHNGNCMTRLRLTLADKSVVDLATLKKIPGVLGVVETNDQMQIVLGPGKAKTASDLVGKIMENTPTGENQPAGNIATANGESLEAIAAAQKKSMKERQTSGIQQFLAKFATIFTPLIPGFIAMGLLVGIATLLEQIYGKQYIAEREYFQYSISYMKVFYIALMGFLPIIVGYNAQKAFGGTGINGAIIAALFVLSYGVVGIKLDAGMTSFMGISIDVDEKSLPRGGIIGALLAGIIGAYVERFVRKFIPDVLDMILTPLFTLVIMGAIVFILIMPFADELNQGMSYLFGKLNGNPVGCAILAGLFLFAVMFGVHQGFIPVYAALVETQGFNSLFPILAMAGGGQVGAAMALYVKAKAGSVTRNQIGGAIIPGFLGIGEPLIYGVTLPRVKPFITACIGGAVGGAFIGTVAINGTQVGLNTVFGASGLLALPMMTSNYTESGYTIFAGMLVYGAALLISYIAGFILTYFFGTKNVDLD